MLMVKNVGGGVPITDYEALQAEKTNLQNQINNLQGQITRLQTEAASLKGRVPKIVQTLPYIIISGYSKWSDGSGTSYCSIAKQNGSSGIVFPSDLTNNAFGGDTSYAIASSSKVTFKKDATFYVYSDAKQEYIGLGTNPARNTGSYAYIVDTNGKESSKNFDWNNTRFGSEAYITVKAGEQLFGKSPSAASGNDIRNRVNLVLYLINQEVLNAISV